MAKRGYHHGNLSQALVDAALALIAEKGPSGFTLTEAARRADVTPAAVYRHFQGRDDVIAETARQGYEIFAKLLERAYDGGRPTAMAAFASTGAAYLDFAHRYPGHYVAMFEAGIDMSGRADLLAAAQRARGILETAAVGLSHQIPAHRRPPPQMFASHIWAMAHGIVELFARNAPGLPQPYRPEDLLESGIGIYLRGLGLIPPDA